MPKIANFNIFEKVYSRVDTPPPAYVLYARKNGKNLGQSLISNSQQMQSDSNRYHLYLYTTTSGKRQQRKFETCFISSKINAESRNCRGKITHFLSFQKRTPSLSARPPPPLSGRFVRSH